MKRRQFITLLGGAAAWPLAAHAQHSTKVARIGFLGLAPAAAWAAPIEALRARLRDLGYVEGRNLVIEWRWAENGNELSELAAQLVHMDVDLIFAYSSTEVEAAQWFVRLVISLQLLDDRLARREAHRSRVRATKRFMPTSDFHICRCASAM